MKKQNKNKEEVVSCDDCKYVVCKKRENAIFSHDVPDRKDKIVKLCWRHHSTITCKFCRLHENFCGEYGRKFEEKL